jgi:ABC-type polysaccharide/polyol phosphate transport system ATPase subunit
VGLVGGFLGTLTARENVKFVTRIYSDSSEIKQKVDFVRRFADIGPYFDQPFNTYSNGMKARVTFGLSMAFKFDVYLLDEVTGVGDQSFRSRAKELIKWRAKNSSFLMVSHNLWGLKVHCDRALVLHGGKITSYDSLEEGIAVHRRHLGVSGAEKTQASTNSHPRISHPHGSAKQQSPPRRQPDNQAHSNGIKAIVGNDRSDSLVKPSEERA